MIASGLRRAETDQKTVAKPLIPAIILADHGLGQEVVNLCNTYLMTRLIGVNYGIAGQDEVGLRRPLIPRGMR